jgi:hypothetical protein
MTITGRAAAGAALLALALGAGGGAAQADEATAKALFKAMTDYVAAQQAISFDYDSTIEIVTTEDQKLALVSSGKVALERPGRFHATRRGGFADAEMGFDGKTLTLVGKSAKLYAEIDAPGSIEEMVAKLKAEYGAPLPAIELLTTDAYDAMMEGVTEAKDLGSGVIGGEECDHLAFRAGDIDWQIWIAQGDAPRPCRFVITTRTVAGWPQYAVEVRDWRTGTEAKLEFDLAVVEGATKVEFAKLTDFSELSGIYAGEGAK